MILLKEQLILFYSRSFVSKPVMRILLPYLFVSILFLLSIPPRSDSHGGEPERKTLVVSLDGFRWDYVDRIRRLLGDQSNIWQLIQIGAYAPKGIKSTFTTMTFPNHYTLVTGLYQENHGIISNLIYDPAQKKVHNLKTEHDKSIYGGEPIWTTLKKQKRAHMHDHGDGEEVVACSMWVACQFGGFDPGYFVNFNESISWSERVDKAIDWLSDESMKLVLTYYNEPDATGHGFGPKSKEMDDKLKELDSNVGELIRKLKDKRMFDDLNLIIASDHGMMDSDERQKEPLLPEKLPEGLFYLRSNGPALWLVEPMPGQFDETIAFFSSFQHLKVFEKANIPDRWHYKNNPRVTPLVIVAEPGFRLSYDLKGVHGYDNDLTEMRPTFIAHGPAFVPNSTVPMDMSTVDVYLLLCTILGLTPAPNNGTALYLEAFVHPAYLVGMKDIFHRTSVVVIAVCIAVIIFALCFFVCHRQRVKSHEKRIVARLSDTNGYMYKPLPLENIGPLLTTSVDIDLGDSDEFEDTLPDRHKP